MRDEIYLRRRNKIILAPHADAPMPPEQSDGCGEAALVAAFAANVSSLGYAFTQDCLQAMQVLSCAEIAALERRIVPVMRKLVGAHVKYKPLYPNFPAQVMAAGEAELVLNALIHYYSSGKIQPHYEKLKRIPLFRRKIEEFRFVDAGMEEEFLHIFEHLLHAAAAFSPADREDLAWFLTHEPTAADCIPETMPFKENAAFVGAFVMRGAVKQDAEWLHRNFRTATDVLRLATALSGGDISLAANAKFRSFTRQERRTLLALLETCYQHSEMEADMLRHRGKWLRLGERLHPSEYAGRFPSAAEAFAKLRNGAPIPRFSSKIEHALERKATADALALLRDRPGELARRLDHLLRTADDGDAVVDAFEPVAGRVSTPVLLQMREHFKGRSERPDGIRAFFPKGEVAKAYWIPDDRPPLDAALCARVVRICEIALISAYSQKPSLGAVYLDERLRDYAVPFSQRSAGKALRTVARGSRIRLQESADSDNTVRCFIWWRNGAERTDIDLSAVFFDESWRYLEHVSYTNLRTTRFGACHSGDIVDAPRGACEYVDTDIAAARRAGARYAVFEAFSYTIQPFCDLPECFMGWMLRDHPQAGEIYEPRTVQNIVDLAADTTIAIPMIFDLRERAVVWADMALRRHPRYYNNVEANMSGITAVCRAIVEGKRPNLHDLISLHIMARGFPVKEKSRANIVFDVEDGVTPYDIDILVGGYL